MLYVGLTEDHKGSATTFAHVVGAQVISQLLPSTSSTERLADNTSGEQSSPIKEFKSANDSYKSGPSDENTSDTLPSEVVEGSSQSTMTVRKLMEAYEVCITSLRKSQSRRRINSLTRIAPVNFTKEARLRVPESTVERIKSLNRLDLELYEYAQDIFARQHDRTMQKLVRNSVFRETLQETKGTVVLNSVGAPPWRESLLVMAVVLVGVCLFINARRRTSKVKV